MSSPAARLKWLTRRISRMSGREVAFRMGRELGVRVRRIAATLHPPRLHMERYSGKEFRPVGWLMDLHPVAEIARSAVGHYHWQDNVAKIYCDHRFSFFAIADRSFGNPIRWNYDYAHAVETPLVFGPTLDYRDERTCGDIKYVWEHNRHHHLVELAKAAYLTRDQRYADEIFAQVDSWITQCPYPLGVQWSSALESAIRVISWTFASAFLHALPAEMLAPHQAALQRWSASAHEHLGFIKRNFSRFSSANNHLIGEACGLFVGASCFQFRESAAWQARAREILEREAIAQHWPDGVNKEQTTSYQVFVFDFLMLAGLLGRSQGKDFTHGYWECLERMAEFVSALIDNKGEVPHIGDDDDGAVAILSHHSPLTVHQSLLSVAAALFGRADFREHAGGFDERAFWLLGPEGERLFEHAAIRPATGLAFRDGGYYILKGHEAWVLFDCGPLGYLSLAAHGHADALSLFLRYKEKNFLIDPGTYAYHTRKLWRDYFRGTAAHTTVRIDRCDQSEIAGNFMWGRKASARLLEFSARSVSGTHDGYMRLASPVGHTRTVTLSPENASVVITDSLSTEGPHTVELFFQCDPECVIRQEGQQVALVQGAARIAIVPDIRMQHVRLLHGSDDPPGGWYSPGYDRKIPSTTIVWETAITGSTDLVTTINLL
jgi:hypothetical protein